MQSNAELTPNQIDSTQTRIQKAKEFLQENPNECRITAARIYSLPESTLRSSMSKPSVTRTYHGGHNKILHGHETEAIHLYIRSLLASHIYPTNIPISLQLNLQPQTCAKP